MNYVGFWRMKAKEDINVVVIIDGASWEGEIEMETWI